MSLPSQPYPHQIHFYLCDYSSIFNTSWWYVPIILSTSCFASPFFYLQLGNLATLFFGHRNYFGQNTYWDCGGTALTTFQYYQFSLPIIIIFKNLHIQLLAFVEICSKMHENHIWARESERYLLPKDPQARKFGREYDMYLEVPSYSFME